MRKRLAIALLPFFTSCLLCVAQTVTVDVADQSTGTCPVRLSGKIELSESEVGGVNRTSYVDHIAVTNLSKAPVVAMVTFSQIGNSYGPLVGQYNQLDA